MWPNWARAIRLSGPLSAKKWNELWAISVYFDLHDIVCWLEGKGYDEQTESSEQKQYLKGQCEKKPERKMFTMFHFVLFFSFLSWLFLSSAVSAGPLLACGSVKLDRWSGTAGRHWYSSTEPQAVASSISSSSENREIAPPQFL